MNTTKFCNDGEIDFIADTYLELVLLISKANNTITSDMKDDLIGFAYAESNTVGADSEVRFLEYEDGKYVAQLFVDELVHIEKLPNDEYSLEIVKESKEKELYDELKGQK